MPHLKSLILLALGAGLLLLAVLRLRRYRLKERYALVFLLLGLPFFALAAWPSAVGRLADFLDVDYRTLTLLGVATVLALMVFELLTIVSVQDQKITALAQLVGILMEKQKLAEPEHTPGSPPVNDETHPPTARGRDAA
jgi:uncharacterized membrane protein